MTRHRNSANYVELGDFKTSPETLSGDRDRPQKKGSRKSAEQAETPRMNAAVR
jgi:hypothetical protein